MWGFIIAIISGALMSIQGVFNTGVMKQTSIWLSAGFVQLTAFIVCIVAYVVSGKEAAISTIWNVNPKYLLLGGALGAFITYTVIKSVGDLGPAKANLLIVIAQILIAYIIELFGLFGCDKVDFEWKKLIGIAIATVGFVIFNWKSV